MLLHSAARSSRALLRAPVLSAARRALSVKVVAYPDDLRNALARDGLVTVYWTASWCGPCQQIAPIYDDLAGEHPQSTFLKVDVDEHAELAADAEIQAMPTFQFFREGEQVNEIVGADVASLQEFVRSNAGT